jgi:DNA-binding MarR family transcriptional regulator
MANDTKSSEAEEQPADEQLQTSGHVERTILHHMVGDDYDRYAPTTVSAVLDDVAAVIERGGYANIGPKNAAGATVRKSTVRRTFKQLHEKGLVQRIEELAESELRDQRCDLGTLDSDGDPDDPTAYSRTSDDARVTDWILTDAGRREVERLDARYAEELDELAARYGRPRGETTARVDA